MMIKTPEKLTCPFDNMVFNTSSSKITKNRFIIQYLEMTKDDEKQPVKEKSSSTPSLPKFPPSAMSEEEIGSNLPSGRQGDTISNDSREEPPDEDYLDEDDYGDSLAYENIPYSQSGIEKGAFSTRFFDSFPSTPRRSCSSVETTSTSAHISNSQTSSSSEKPSLTTLFKRRTLTVLGIQQGKFRTLIDNILSDPTPPESTREAETTNQSQSPPMSSQASSSSRRTESGGEEVPISTFFKTRAMNKLNAQQEKFRSFFDNYLSDQRSSMQSQHQESENSNNHDHLYPDLDDVN